MKFKTMPTDVVIEILLYLTENESFESVAKGFNKQISPEDVREIFYEIVSHLRKDLKNTDKTTLKSASFKKHLSKNSLAVLEALSPKEEAAILRDFGLSDE